MSDELMINEKPVSISFYPGANENDCAISIHTDKGRVLDLTRTDALTLIDRLTSTLESFDSIKKKECDHE